MSGGAREGWKCLSVQQPFAWAIVVGAKDIENRTWKSNHIGRLYIHAGQKERTDLVDEVAERVARCRNLTMSAALDDYRQHVEFGRGAVVGSVNMLGCAVSHMSEWFDRRLPYGFMFTDAKRIEPVPVRGRQRFFSIPAPL